MKLSNIFKSSARKKGEALAQIVEKYDPRARVSDVNAEAQVIQLAGEGARTDIVNGDGMSPLMGAAYKGLTKALQPLIEAGADIEARSTERCMIPNLTPLMW